MSDVHVKAAKEAMQALAAKASEVVKSDLTQAEKKEALDKIEVDLKQHSDTVSLHEQAKRLTGGAEAAPEEKSVEAEVYKSFGQSVVESEAFQSARKAAQATARFSFSAEIKAAGNIDEGTTVSGGFTAGKVGPAILPDYLPGIVDLRFAPITVSQLFAQGSTSSDLVSYVKESAETNGAAATAEGGTYGQSDFTLTRVAEQVGKITAFGKLTDEAVQDFSQAQSFFQQRLVSQLQREEENEVLNGTGYPALSGVLGRAGLATTIAVGTGGTALVPTKAFDALYQQVTAIRTTAFVEPDAIVMNPADWQNIKLAKDSNGQYYVGGPFLGQYGNGQYSNVSQLWGLPVVQSPRIAAGTALVGSFQECAQLFRRTGITVEMTNSNEADFKSGLIAVRAQSRGALAVYRPGGFGEVTMIWA